MASREHSRRLLVWGDSNSYGFDPDWGNQGGRYPAEDRWPDILAKALEGSWQVHTDALPGRCIPTLRFEWEALAAAVDSCGRPDLFAVMLGTNDHLSASRPDPERVGERMEEFLTQAMAGPLAGADALVIAPPYMDFGADRYYARFSTMSGSLSRAMEACAGRVGAGFLDAGALPLAPDGIHLLPEGHRLLAGKVLAWIQDRYK